LATGNIVECPTEHVDAKVVKVLKSLGVFYLVACIIFQEEIQRHYCWCYCKAILASWRIFHEFKDYKNKSVN
jgi:hypothetical protein